MRIAKNYISILILISNRRITYLATVMWQGQQWYIKYIGLGSKSFSLTLFRRCQNQGLQLYEKSGEVVTCYLDELLNTNCIETLFLTHLMSPYPPPWTVAAWSPGELAWSHGRPLSNEANCPWRLSHIKTEQGGGGSPFWMFIPPLTHSLQTV